MAKYLIDANLPRRLKVWSSDECLFVHDINPSWRDHEIRKFGYDRGLTIVTKDADFADFMFVGLPTPRIIHIRLGNMKFAEFEAYLERVWDDVCQMSEGYHLVRLYRDRIEGVD
jgi:predicted nuclease of predicted toxin-antitoxin system